MFSTFYHLLAFGKASNTEIDPMLKTIKEKVDKIYSSLYLAYISGRPPQSDSLLAKRKNTSPVAKTAPGLHQRGSHFSVFLRGRGQEPGSLECHSPVVQNVTNLLALEDLAYRGISLVQFVAYKKMDYF